MPLLWAGSLILAAALGAVIAGTIGGPSLRGGPSGQDVRRVDVLTLGPGVEWPADFEAGWSVEAGTRFADLTIVRMRQRGAASSECLMVSVPRAAGAVSTDERVYGGCRVGGFSARAEMVVDRAAPGALRGRFPVGTGLQFVLVGDRVEVYTDRP